MSSSGSDAEEDVDLDRNGEDVEDTTAEEVIPEVNSDLESSDEGTHTLQENALRCTLIHTHTTSL